MARARKAVYTRRYRHPSLLNTLLFKASLLNPFNCCSSGQEQVVQAPRCNQARATSKTAFVGPPGGTKGCVGIDMVQRCEAV